MIVYNKLYLLINHVIIVLCIYDKKKTLRNNRISSIGTKSLNHTINLCQIKAYCMKVFL